MKVYWTDEALTHLDGIFRHIAEDSPVYARRMVDKITRRSQQIGGFPQSGRMVPEYQDTDIREVIELPYRIASRRIEWMSWRYFMVRSCCRTIRWPDSAPVRMRAIVSAAA